MRPEGPMPEASQSYSHQLEGLGERCKLPHRGTEVRGGAFFVHSRWLFLAFQKRRRWRHRSHVALHIFTVRPTFRGGGGVEPMTPCPLKYGPGLKQRLTPLALQLEVNDNRDD